MGMSQQLYSQLRPVYQSLIIYPFIFLEKSRPLSVVSGRQPAFSQFHKPFVLSLQVMAVNPGITFCQSDGLPVK